MAKEFHAVVTDIEGTTTSISFVHEVLFPYARDNVHTFLSEGWGSTETATHVAALEAQAAADGEKLDSSSVDAVATYVKDLIKADKKVAALKNLQGAIWKGAYESGSVKGHVYDDVVPSLNKFKKDGIPVYIYSSGSIAAQKLIFGYSDKGDILHHFKGHYDTSIGFKQERDSYSKIAKDIGLEPSKILFLSDNVKEIDAAHKAGYLTCILFRPGNAELVPAPVKSKYTLPDGTLVPVAKQFFAIFSFNTFFVPAMGLAPAPVKKEKKAKKDVDVEEEKKKDGEEDVKKDSKKKDDKKDTKKDSKKRKAVDVVDEENAAAVVEDAKKEAVNKKDKKGKKEVDAVASPSKKAKVVEAVEEKEEAVEKKKSKKTTKKEKKQEEAVAESVEIEEVAVVDKKSKKEKKRAAAAIDDEEQQEEESTKKRQKVAEVKPKKEKKKSK
ncbi:UNVERIFIED_CONTAM: hypothetical protein HDU68_001135 [Siphonaria sp. JEL0065]|nr:hypothetical protein HDU68_001135 [Siphonaria sp. JEL0065]